MAWHLIQELPYILHPCSGLRQSECHFVDAGRVPAGGCPMRSCANQHFRRRQCLLLVLVNAYSSYRQYPEQMANRKPDGFQIMLCAIFLGCHPYHWSQFYSARWPVHIRAYIPISTGCYTKLMHCIAVTVAHLDKATTDAISREWPLRTKFPW